MTDPTPPAHAAEVKALIDSIRAKLPIVAIGHPELAGDIDRALSLVEAEARPKTGAGQALLDDMGLTRDEERGQRLEAYIRAIEREAAERNAQAKYVPLGPRIASDGGRLSRGGWHYIACWQTWVTDPENRECICDRLRTAVTVASCPEHDKDGPPHEDSGFPTCSKCAAILTEETNA